jgi:hypothetical protein
MADLTDEHALYGAEERRYLQLAQRDGLLSADDAQRLDAAYRITARRTRGPLRGVLPRLLLDAQDGRVLDDEPGPEQAVARWSLYERLRAQTQERHAA